MVNTDRLSGVQVKVTFTELFLPDYYFTVTGSILLITSLTIIYFSTLTGFHDRERKTPATNNGHKLWPFFLIS